MRKTQEVVIDDQDPENRDGGKHYIITEMPATKGEKWAARAINALLASGIEIPDKAIGQGMKGLAMLGSSGFSNFRGVSWEALEPLMDEMMSCVTRVHDTGSGRTRPVVENDIEEIKTRLLLRNAWLELHIGFSFAGAPKISDSAPATTEDLSSI